jgi:hypothetical protein
VTPVRCIFTANPTQMFRVCLGFRGELDTRARSRLTAGAGRRGARRAVVTFSAASQRVSDRGARSGIPTDRIDSSGVGEAGAESGRQRPVLGGGPDKERTRRVDDALVAERQHQARQWWPAPADRRTARVRAAGDDRTRARNVVADLPAEDQVGYRRVLDPETQKWRPPPRRRPPHRAREHAGTAPVPAREIPRRGRVVRAGAPPAAARWAPSAPGGSSPHGPARWDRGAVRRDRAAAARGWSGPGPPACRATHTALLRRGAPTPPPRGCVTHGSDRCCRAPADRRPHPAAGRAGAPEPPASPHDRHG